MNESDRHRLLAVERRRVALDVLAGRTAPVELDELATEIAVRETDDGVPRDDFVERVAITLHHNHLPKMAGVGTVEYDQASRRIEAISVTADLL